jgi:hypothetical protein
MTWHYGLVSIILFALVFGSHYSWATPLLSVSTKQVYEYGDLLTITFQVSELTGDPIVLHIIDESGKASSPIPIQLGKLNSTIIAPIPFYKTTYPPGRYTVDAEYSGAKASTSFDLIDSDRIAIPIQYKILLKSWLLGATDNKDLASVIRELIHFDIIKISGYESQMSNAIHIPTWFKKDVKWWSDDSINDNEFGLAIQYLIKAGFMSV